ncbi:hypothetical protein EVAR_24884_1 [Eumeta japonica]|uniref:Uncharacterized protein n=1 Tax=Eumeta variegata TaxID=151549 RepID=A0A4C1V645_EUMVA|nr:hypothetical protein EVAR_24884_1 [Eumeta japonica]
MSREEAAAGSIGVRVRAADKRAGGVSTDRASGAHLTPLDVGGAARLRPFRSESRSKRMHSDIVYTDTNDKATKPLYYSIHVSRDGSAEFKSLVQLLRNSRPSRSAPHVRGPIQLTYFGSSRSYAVHADASLTQVERDRCRTRRPIVPLCRSFRALARTSSFKWKASERGNAA